MSCAVGPSHQMGAAQCHITPMSNRRRAKRRASTTERSEKGQITRSWPILSMKNFISYILRRISAIAAAERTEIEILKLVHRRAMPPSKKAKTAHPTAPKPVEDVAGESDFKSLTQWLMANTKDKELTVLMAQLALACKATSRACAKAGIANLFGMAGDQNSSGDDQKVGRPLQ